MDYKRVESLLSRYDSGQSTKEEEQELRLFFAKDGVPEHWTHYKMLFSFFEQEHQTQSVKTFIPPKTRPLKSWISVAAAILCVGLFVQQYNAYTQQQQAQEAYDQTVEIFTLVGDQMTKGTAKLSYLKAFSETTNQFIKQ